MGGFFKKLFKDSSSSTNEKDEMNIINNLVDEIMAEEDINSSHSQVVTNKFPNITPEMPAEVLSDFSSYKFYSSTHIGMVKENNQDSIFTAEFNCSTNGRSMNLALGIVADGMGGFSMGEIASITAISSVSTFLYARIAEYFQDGLPDPETILAHIKNAILNANAILKDKATELGEDMGTTFTLALLVGNTACFGHVGDSRAYIIDANENYIEKVTRDHSLVGRMIEMGQLTESEAKSHPRRNEIYRTLGLRDSLEVDTFCRVMDKNSVIVLMSDGLWEFVDDSDILKETVHSLDLAHTSEKLIQMANDRGGGDNISVVLIKPEEKG